MIKLDVKNDFMRSQKRHIELFRNFDQIIEIMDLQTRKLELIRVFLNLQNETIITRIENLLKKEGKTSKTELVEHFTLDEFNTRMDKSLADSSKENVIDAQDLIEEIKGWN